MRPAYNTLLYWVVFPELKYWQLQDLSCGNPQYADKKPQFTNTEPKNCWVSNKILDLLKQENALIELVLWWDTVWYELERVRQAIANIEWRIIDEKRALAF